MQVQRLSLQPLHAPFNSINCLISAATAAAASSLAAKTFSNRPLKRRRRKEQVSNLTDLWPHPKLPIDEVILYTLLGFAVVFLFPPLPSCSFLSPLPGSWPGRDLQCDQLHLLPLTHLPLVHLIALSSSTPVFKPCPITLPLPGRHLLICIFFFPQPFVFGPTPGVETLS